MENIRKAIETDELLMMELSEDGVTKRRRVMRCLMNSGLRIRIAEMGYHDMRAEHGIESSITHGITRWGLVFQACIDLLMDCAVFGKSSHVNLQC